MRLAIALAGVGLLSGCGTIDTVFREDAVVSQRLAEFRSSCDSIPRVYSGVAIDFCSLTGGPHKRPPSGIEGGRFNNAGSVVIDMALSGITDTLVLPYTIYAQSADGSIPKSRID